MKKWMAILMALSMMMSLASCGEKKETDNSKESEFKAATEVLDKVFKSYKESEAFPISGGDTDNMKEEKAGVFDLSKTEELDFLFGIPSEELKNVEEAATVAHSYNGNTFSCIAFKMKKDADKNTFADNIKAHILKKEWICGMPETLLIVDVDSDYFISCFGVDSMIKTFKTHVEEELKGSKIILEQGL